MSALNSHQRILLTRLKPGDHLAWRRPGTSDKVERGFFCHVAKGGHVVACSGMDLERVARHHRVPPRLLLQAGRWKWDAAKLPAIVKKLEGGSTLTIYPSRPGRWVPLEYLPPETPAGPLGWQDSPTTHG